MITIREQVNRGSIFWFVLGFIIIVGVGVQWSHLNRLVWSSDEGIHLSAAYLVNQGLVPYRQVSFSQGPLFLELVRWPLQWQQQWGSGAGNDLTMVRLALLCFGLLSLIALALIGRALKNDLAGWAAALALLALPSFFYFARAVMADGPAVALGLWAAWAAIRFFCSGKRGWLIAAGILLGLSLAIKFLTIYALGWIGLLILYRIWFMERPPRLLLQVGYTMRDGLLFGGSTLLTVLFIYLWYDLPLLLNSIFGMRVAMRTAFGSWAANNRDEIAEFWQYHAPLVILAGYGLLGQLRTHRQAWPLVSWLLLIGASLRIQNPLYHQHLQLLLPVLALLAGLGIATMVDQIHTSHSWRLPFACSFRPVLTIVSFISGLILVSWLLIFTTMAYRTPNRYTEISNTGLRTDQVPIVAFLHQFTAPTDCVVTDDLNLAFISRRFPPPMLIDLSSARLATESISDDRLERLTARAGCQVIAPLTDRIFEFSPGYATWSAETFLGTWRGEDDAQLWLAQPVRDPDPTLTIEMKLGDQILLHGAELEVDQTEQLLYLSLYWQGLSPLTVDYKIFVHLRDSQNQTVVNADHFPYDNLVPTTRWPVGSTIKETIQLALPSEGTLTDYQLDVGMYDPETEERLPVAGDESGENAIIIPIVQELL